MSVELEAMEGRSRDLLSTAATVLPGACLGQNTLPPELSFVVDRGEGSRLIDLRGRSYLDYVLGSGPLLLGHAHPAMVRAVQEQVARGSTFFWLSEPSVRLAEMVVRAVPCAEQVRFVSTGTEATMFACRMARTFTRREKILKFEGGWHGSTTTPWSGTGACRRRLRTPTPARTSAASRAARSRASWSRPSTTSRRPSASRPSGATTWRRSSSSRSSARSGPRPAFWPVSATSRDRLGALLIFDEVVTGFRLAYGGAQEHYGVCPTSPCTARPSPAGSRWPPSPGAPTSWPRPTRPGRARSTTPRCRARSRATRSPARPASRRSAELARPGVYQRLHALGERLRSGIARRAEQVGVPVQVLADGPIAQVFFVDPDADLTQRPRRSGRPTAARRRASRWNACSAASSPCQERSSTSRWRTRTRTSTGPSTSWKRRSAPWPDGRKNGDDGDRRAPTIAESRI